MIASIVAAVLYASALGLWWWYVSAHLGKARGDALTSQGADRADSEVAAVADGSDPRLLAQLTIEWADPTQSWPALDTENALLAELLAGRIDRAEYRERLFRLAGRCEPAPDDRR